MRGDDRQPACDQANRLRKPVRPGGRQVSTHYGGLLHEHWERKRRDRSSSPTRASITGTRWGASNGAVGGKLIGAGGGGFLMFLADDPMRLRCAMEAEGLAELRFKIDFAGTRIL